MRTRCRCARVEALREQAARVAAELGEAERALEHVAITRATLAAVLAPLGGAGPQVRDAGLPRRGEPEPTPVPRWRADLAEAHLPAGYRELWRAVVHAPGPVRAKDLALALGLAVTAAKTQALRSKLKRLVARSWITEPRRGVRARVYGACFARRRVMTRTIAQRTIASCESWRRS